MILRVTNYCTNPVKLYYPDGPTLEHKESVELDFDTLTDREATDVMQICWENVCGYVEIREPRISRVELLLDEA